MTSDGTTLRLYVNGKQVDTASAKAAMESKGPLLIGCAKNFGEYFNGTIDNVRVFNRTLNASEVESDKGSAVKVPAPEGPSAAYALDETSGTAAKDAAGAHNATVSGTASWVEGKYGKALNFNGENTCAQVANSSDLQLSGPFTLEAWVKPSNTTQWAPIFYKEAGSFYGYSIFFGAFNAGHIQGYISEHSWEYTEVESPGTLTANTWSHVAMTSDGATMRLYVNGTQVDTSPASAAISSTGPLLIGCAKNFNEYFKGAIDNVRIFNRALTAGEVEADKAAAVGSSSGPMQSGIAKTEITLDGKVVDSSTGCAAENCSVAREWTLSSAPNPGKHTVVAKVSDGFGNTTSKTTEIEVQPDTTKPAITTGGTLSSAPSGWVEQQGYGFTASAKDAGYGVTSLALKVDGTQVASTSASCADGGCEATVQKTIEMASYSGGAHPAEVVATDGAGNTSTQKWTINVDPEGHITMAEATATLEAVEGTSSVNPVGPSRPEAEIYGTTYGLGVAEAGGAIQTTEGAVPTTIAAQSAAGLKMEILPDGALSGSCGEEFGNGEEEAENSPEVEEPEPMEPCEPLSLEDPAAAPLESIEISPISIGGTAGEAQIVGDSSTLATNTTNHVDTVTRPLYEGALTFQEIRNSSAPQTYTWEVALAPNQELRSLDDQHAAVYYAGGHPALGIVAEPAHDAVGTSVPTNLEVSEGKFVTLHVEHRSAPYVYPVLGGAGWQGGFTTTIVEGPKDEQELREERERIEREEREAREALEAGEQIVPVVSEAGVTTIVHVVVKGPPLSVASASGPDNGSSAYTLEHKFKSNECRYRVPEPEGGGGTAGIGGPGEQRRENIDACVHERGRVTLLVGLAVHGWYRDNQVINKAWIPKGNLHCDKWGPEEPKMVQCEKRPGQPVSAPNWIEVLGDYRFAPGKGNFFSTIEGKGGTSACDTVRGRIDVDPSPRELPSILTPAPTGELCSWP